MCQLSYGLYILGVLSNTHRTLRYVGYDMPFGCPDCSYVIIVMQPWRIYLDATPGIYRNHVARCQQRIPTVPDIYTPWRPMQHSGNLINKPVAD